MRVLLCAMHSGSVTECMNNGFVYVRYATHFMHTNTLEVVSSERKVDNFIPCLIFINNQPDSSPVPNDFFNEDTPNRQDTSAQSIQLTNDAPAKTSQTAKIKGNRDESAA